MFTGIIQDLGTINTMQEGLYKISTNLDLSNARKDLQFLVMESALQQKI